VPQCLDRNLDLIIDMIMVTTMFFYLRECTQHYYERAIRLQFPSETSMEESLKLPLDLDLDLIRSFARSFTHQYRPTSRRL